MNLIDEYYLPHLRALGYNILGMPRQERRVNPMLVLLCSHEQRPAHACSGDDCRPMSYDEVIKFCMDMWPDNTDEAIATAFELGKRIGWTRKHL